MDSKNPHFHTFATCGRFKYFTVTKQTKKKILNENGEIEFEKHLVRWKRCYKHQINICWCGFEYGWHDGTDSRLMNPPSAFNPLTNKKLWD
jgi:hypothetical protein